MSKIILIGGGGHCHACIDVIESKNEFEILGIIDVKEKLGQYVLGYPIIGIDDDLIKFRDKNVSFIITLGHIKSSSLRKNVFDRLQGIDANIATIISDSALVSKYSTLGKGSIVMHKASVGPNVTIGNNCIVNTNANIEHDTIIGDNVHISTHAVINGNCELKDNIFIGSNSTIFQGISIRSDVTIGAGSVITKNIVASGIFYGNPILKK